MNENRWRHLTGTAVSQAAQVKDFTITAVSTGMTADWTFTMTDDNGDTHTVTAGEGGSPYTDDVADALVAAWNASTNPMIQLLTATKPAADKVRLTADTAGRPFTVTLDDDSDGTHTETDVTDSVGFNDFQFADNWSSGTLPDIYDDAVFEAGQVHALYNLNYSAVPIGGFFVEKGCQSQFGRLEFGQYKYLRLDPGAFEYRGNGRLALFDLGSASIDPYVEAHGSPSTQGVPVVFIKGTDFGTLEIGRGAVGVAALPGDEATVNTILVSGDTQQGAFQSLTDILLGSGLTLTTLNLSSGRCTMRCAATTANVSAGAILITEGVGAIPTLNVYGTAYPNSDGTVTNLHVHGLVDFSRDRTPRTVTNCFVYPGGTLIYPPDITFTNNIVPVTPETSDPRQIVIRPVA